MKRYEKFGHAAPLRFRVILEKPRRGGGGKMTPTHTRAKVNSIARGVVSDALFLSSDLTSHKMLMGSN